MVWSKVFCVICLRVGQDSQELISKGLFEKKSTFLVTLDTMKARITFGYPFRKKYQLIKEQ